MNYKWRYIKNIIIIIFIAVTLFSVCFVLVKTAGENYINENEELNLSLNLKDDTGTSVEKEDMPADDDTPAGDMMVDFLDDVYDFFGSLWDKVSNLQTNI